MLRTFAIAAATGLTLALAAPAFAQGTMPPHEHFQPAGTISVSGTGQVMTAPDMATLSIGVETRAETASAAVASNNEAAQRVIETLKQNGVEPRNVQTANFSVSPVYDETSYQRREGPRIIGYQATNQVVARIEELDSLGTLLDATVTSGANRIDGLSFGLQDDTAITDEARAKAVEDARRKAELYARAAGVKLGGIRSISEGGHGPIPMYDMRAAAAPEAMKVPIERGQTTVTASVQVVWDVDQATGQ